MQGQSKKAATDYNIIDLQNQVFKVFNRLVGPDKAQASLVSNPAGFLKRVDQALEWLDGRVEAQDEAGEMISNGYGFEVADVVAGVQAAVAKGAKVPESYIKLCKMLYLDRKFWGE